MRKHILAFILLQILVLTSANAQDAATILDRAVNLFRKTSGTEVEFLATSTNKNTPSGSIDGTIQLKDNKFRLETPTVISWFDGTTQWSYMKRNDEVNITTPTKKELQSINPYTLLSLHHNGYTASTGKNTQYRGLPVHEVILSAPDSDRLIQQVTVCLNRDTNEPVLIRVRQSDGITNEIVVKQYRVGKNWNNSHFKFSAKDYPSAEIIDLR